MGFNPPVDIAFEPAYSTRQYEWIAEIHHWPLSSYKQEHKWCYGQSLFWPLPRASAKSAADALGVLMWWMIV
ncbi:hypothetical protein TI24_20760 [Vibrio vulnificus]|nr:hypothetical protein VVCECT4999_14780 [Vibrio vulnificus]KGK69900.1 hypothetical protein NA76_13375 [Vibrio vulnificus]PNG68010.1 hypothetical protein TI24_20760 [Vibrio vulnificus]PNG72957.1 hypothetical protein TI31_21960 [Vibrio vulnificus]